MEQEFLRETAFLEETKYRIHIVPFRTKFSYILVIIVYYIQLADRSGLFKNAIRKKILGTREKVDSNGIAKHLTERSTVTYLQCYRPVD